MYQPEIMKDRIVLAVKEFASSIKPGSKVMADMSSLVEATSQIPLSNFDYWERLIRSEFSTAMRESTPSKWKPWSKPIEILTWLDLTSWDGYRREKTLRTLSGAAPNTFFFSLAVRRLNDWVPEVRAAARDTLLELAKASNPEYVVEALCVALSNWGSWGRIEDADKDVLLNIIGDENIAQSLIQKIMFSASGPMTSLFSQLGRTPILDGRMEEIASFAVQPSLRAKAYRSLFESRVTWLEGRKWVWTDIRYCEKKLIPIVSERKLSVETPILDLLQKSAKDRSSIVRRVSAEILIRELDTLGGIGKELADKFASDSSDAVSERGKFALKKLVESGRADAS
ncbi:hypothetical protein MAH1_37130 [Sessilibacter sp. MAH1]